MFKHLGAAENKALIEIYVKELNINISVPNCEAVIMFQRGDKKVQTNPVKLQNKMAQFDQKLGLPATLYYDVKKKEYQSKLGSLIVLIKYDKGVKQAGLIDIDFATYLNQRIAQKNERSPLQKCPDPNALLTYTINFLSQEKRSKTPEANINQIREDQSKGQMDQLILENKKLKQENLQLNMQLEEARKAQLIKYETPTAQPDDCMRCAELEQQIDQLNTEKKQLQKRKQECEKCPQLLQQIELLKQQPIQQQSIQQQQPNNKIELLNQANMTLKEQNYELEQAINKFKKENQDLKSKLTIQNQQLLDCRERIQELENDGEKDNRIAEYQKMIEKCNDDNLELQHKLFTFQNETEQLIREKEGYEQQLDQVSKKYDLLEEQLFKQKQKFLNAMQQFLAQGDTNAIEILENCSDA